MGRGGGRWGSLVGLGVGRRGALQREPGGPWAPTWSVRPEELGVRAGAPVGSGVGGSSLSTRTASGSLVPAPRCGESQVCCEWRWERGGLHAQGRVAQRAAGRCQGCRFLSWDSGRASKGKGGGCPQPYPAGVGGQALEQPPGARTAPLVAWGRRSPWGPPGFPDGLQQPSISLSLGCAYTRGITVPLPSSAQLCGSISTGVPFPHTRCMALAGRRGGLRRAA